MSKGRNGQSILLLLYGGLLLAPLSWVLWEARRGEAIAELESLIQQMDLPILLANSLFLALTTTLLATFLGLPLGLLLSAYKSRVQPLLLALALVPLLIPPHIHTIAWARVMGDRGWLTLWIRQMGAEPPDIRAPLGTPGEDLLLGSIYWGPAWVMACAYFPLMVFSVRAGVQSLDRDGLDAARLTPGSRPLRHIVLPQILPRILAAAAFIFILSLASYPVVSLLDTPTLIQKVFFALHVSTGNPFAATVLGLPLVLMAFLGIFLLTTLDRGRAIQGDRARQSERAPEGVGSHLVACLLLGLALIVPLVSLLLEAGPLRLFGEEPDNYQMVFSRVRTAFVESFLLSGSGVLVLSAVGAIVGRILARRRSVLLDSGMLAFLAVPPEVLALSLLVLFSGLASGSVPLAFGAAFAAFVALPWFRNLSQRAALRNAFVWVVCVFAASTLFSTTGLARSIQQQGFTLLLLAWLGRFLPFIARIFRQGYETIDEDSVFAAQLAGRGAASRWLCVELPALRPTLCLAAVFSWVLCFTELPATLVALRPGWQTVQMRIFNMVHYQSIGEVSALCVLSILGALAPLVIWRLLLSGGRTS